MGMLPCGVGGWNGTIIWDGTEEGVMPLQLPGANCHHEIKEPSAIVARNELLIVSRF